MLRPCRFAVEAGEVPHDVVLTVAATEDDGPSPRPRGDISVQTVISGETDDRQDAVMVRVRAIPCREGVWTAAPDRGLCVWFRCGAFSPTPGGTGTT